MSPPPPWPRPPDAAAPLAAHRRRVQLMLYAGSAMLALAALGWGSFFGLRGNWPIFALDLVMLALAALTAWLAQRHQLRAAGLVLVPSLCALLVMMGVLMDVPTAAAPRSVHVYLLALGVASTLIFAKDSSPLRHGLPLLCFGAFLVLASLPFGLSHVLQVGDDVRVVGTWLNNLGALLVLFITLRILQVDVAERSAVAADLRVALAGAQFELYFQPQVDDHGRVVSTEALLRWRHPLRGLVSPLEFIGDAEACGLIHPIGEWVLVEACRQLARWAHDPALATLPIAVNVSAQEFRRPDYAVQVLSKVAASGIDPTRLKLELTESVLVEDIDDVAAKGIALKAQGIGLSLDDFGTGYSSLSYLRKLPLDQLKIDQSFVRDVLTDAGDATIARSIIGLGQSLGLTVIAEGVETLEQRQFLADNGCRIYQGFLFSPPLPVADFEAYVHSAGAVESCGAEAQR